MDVSEQVEEIVASNGPRIQATFGEVSRRVKMYKRAMNVWTFDTVEERALEVLLVQALTEHLESRAPQTLVSSEFYAIRVQGRPPEGVEIQVFHPLSGECALNESYEPAQRLIDSAYEES
jgi:hypothetical protein